MNMNVLKQAAIVVAFVISVTGMFAQAKGTITGKVIDKNTGDVLPGTTVMIEGTTSGTATSIDGVYYLKADSGTYNILCTFISYQTQLVKNVEVRPNSVVTIDFALGDNTELEEVVIEARTLLSQPTLHS